MIYLDSSALAKLVIPEAETVALRAYLGVSQPCGSSELARAEVLRAAARSVDPTTTREATYAMLATLSLAPVTTAVLNAAGIMPPPLLRTLDAIHLASARMLGNSLTAFVTYDRRLADAGRDADLPVATPS